MYDHYVPALIDMLMERSEFLTPVHALPAGDLPGRAAGDVRVPDGDLRADRPARLERLHLRGPVGGRRRRLPGEAPQRPPPVRGQRGPSPAHDRRRCAPTRTAIDMEVVEVPLTRRRHRRRRLGGGDRRRHERRDLRAAELLRRRRGRRGAQRRRARGRRRQGARSSSPRSTRSRSAILRSPGECGVDVAVGEGQSLGNRLDFGGPSFGLFAAREEYLRRMPGRIAGETARRRRPPRLRAHAADARAAHPPRESDLEHLHRRRR